MSIAIYFNQFTTQRMTSFSFANLSVMFYAIFLFRLNAYAFIHRWKDFWCSMLNLQFHGAHTFTYLFTTWLNLVFFVQFRFPIEKIKSNFHTKITLSKERQHQRSTNNTNGFISVSVINWNCDSKCINIIKASALVPRQQSTEEEYKWHVIQQSSNWKTSEICIVSIKHWNFFILFCSCWFDLILPLSFFLSSVDERNDSFNFQTALTIHNFLII